MLAHEDDRSMGAHEYKGALASRASRLASKLGPGITTVDRLEALLAGRTCDCQAFGMLHRPDQCARIRATPGPPPDPTDEDVEPWPEYDEGGEG